MSKKILIIDDDEMIRLSILDYLEQKKFIAIGAPDGKAGLEAVEKEKPDLILLDVELPDLSGYEVCQKIRELPTGRHTPIIMLTAHSMEKEELRGFRSGADDYIAKPFKPAKLLARIETAIGRNARELNANALTHLPGNVAILEEIQNRIQSSEPFSVLYFDLNNFKEFNDHYGFVRGDDAIQLTAKILIDAFARAREQKPFLGHVGGDDFVGLIGSHDLDSFCTSVLAEFDKAVPQLYDDSDRTRGMIVSTDRMGHRVEVSLMGLAVAVVTNRNRIYKHPGEIALVAGELKHWVKSLGKSGYRIDRRTQ